MSKRKSFTLIEAIYVIVILAFLLIGGFQIINKLFVRNFIAKQTSDFEFISQQTLDQVSLILYSRIPLSVIGYDPVTHDFKYIGDIEEGESYPVLEWIGYASEAMKDYNLSGFIDLYGSDKNSKKIKCMDFNYTFIENVLKNKYDNNNDLNETAAVIFAGSFDRGEEGVLSDYNDSFGWHGHKHEYVYTFDEPTSSTNNNTFLTLNDFQSGNIYEKFYLADGAYAIALLKDLNDSLFSQCGDLNLNKFDKSTTLVLFYNYRPWMGETFCADNNGTPAGNVTILAENVNAFKVRKVNSHLELLMELFKSKADINVSVSKQKVAF